MKNQNQSRLGRTRFPALGAGYVYLLWIIIGSMSFLDLLWLAIVIALVLVSRDSIENCSDEKKAILVYQGTANWEKTYKPTGKWWKNYYNYV